MAQSSELPHAEVAVIGAGPGGYAAAFLAADRGMNVALVSEEERAGGVCLLRGCIPSKALLHVAKVIHEASEASEWGVAFGKPKIDVATLRSFKEGVVDKLASGVAQLIKQRKVTFYHARATFVDGKTLELKGKDSGTLTFDNAIIASGSKPAMPGVFDIQDDRIVNSTGALALPDVPKRLLVVGGGYIGLEMGSVYAALGSEVTVVEMTEGLLPGADRDLVRPLEKRLREQFEAILLKTKVAGVKATKDGIVARLEGDVDPAEQTFDRVLVSVGRLPNSTDLGLEKTSVVVNEKGFIDVDEERRTAEPNVFAIGDVAGEPMLAHKASHEGRLAVDVIAGEPVFWEKAAIPAVVFTDPEVAWCGLTETQAKAEGRPVKVTRFPWAASGRAISIGRPEGVTKLIFDPESERVLGVGICGSGAGELIAEGVLAVEMAAVARDVAETIHPHPTLTETIGEAAEAFLGSATHIYQRRK